MTSNKHIKEVEHYLIERLNGYDIKNYSYVVLGCTHFPLFINQFKEIFGNEVNIIDGSQGVVNNLINKVASLVNVDNKDNFKSNIKLILTKEDEIFCEKFKKITNLDNFDIIIKN